MSTEAQRQWNQVGSKTAADARSAHGTVSRYKMHCRCEACRAAASVEGRNAYEARKANKAFRVAAMDPSKHGTRNGYRIGCRCDACKKAESEYTKDIYARTTAERRTK